MSERRNFPVIASHLLKIISGLLTLSLLIQFFLAGMSSLTAPDWWEYHKLWVGYFQWLVLPLPLLAWFCGKPRGGRILFASLPIVQIALQYILVHRALDGRWPIGVGLHAANGAVMLIVATMLTLGWHDGRNPSSAGKAE